MTPNSYFINMQILLHEGVNSDQVFLDCEVNDGCIQSAQIEPGYFHRGIEKSLEHIALKSAPLFCMKLCSFSSISHSLASAKAIEMIAKTEIPYNAKLLRVLSQELERITACLANIVQICYAFNDAVLLAHFDRIYRETELMLDKWIERCSIVPGGVVCDSIDNILTETIQYLKYLRSEFVKLQRSVGEQEVLMVNLEDFAVLDQEKAAVYSVTGLLARSAGIGVDARSFDDIYPDLGWKMCTEESGSALSRLNINVKEMIQSSEIAVSASEILKTEKLNKLCVMPDYQKGIGIARVESPGGEIIHYIDFEEGSIPKMYRIKTAEEVNTPFILNSLKNLSVYDVKAALATFPLCMACFEK